MKRSAPLLLLAFVAGLSVLLAGPAAAQAPCEKPEFVWTPQSTGGTGCGGHCGFFHTPSLDFFVTENQSYFSWKALAGYKIETVGATSARGAEHRAKPGANAAPAAQGDRWASVRIVTSNCLPPQPVKRPESDSDSPSPIWVAVAAVAALAAGGGVAAVWLRERMA